MSRLLGSQNSGGNDTILRDLFLQKLPEKTTMILAAVEDITLNRFAEPADDTADYSVPAVHAVTTDASHTWVMAAERME